MSPTVAVLIATANREALLQAYSLRSVLSQTRLPDAIVIVNDGLPFEPDTQESLVRSARERGVQLVALGNERVPGAAGAWNTGLVHLWRTGHRGFVAILDDDDAWDDSHLEVNLGHAKGADLVVSGLRMRVRGEVQARPLIETLRDRDFLTGNPGWQGSNTFVSLPVLMAIGGFRDGLASLNDRDLAIRLLRIPKVCWRLTGCWTATWTRDTPGNLSSPLSAAKLAGLRRFWKLYGAEMSASERCAYFERAERFFGFERSVIEEAHVTLVQPESAYGSLHE